MREEVGNALDRAITVLRAYAGVHGEVTRAFAASLGLHASDANALVEIILAEDAGRPVSPATLAAKTGASRSAVSAVINRLEAAGHVSRRRDSPDRRVITLGCAPPVQLAAQRFFVPISAEVAREIERHGVECVTSAALVVEALGAAMLRGVERLDRGDSGSRIE